MVRHQHVARRDVAVDQLHGRTVVVGLVVRVRQPAADAAGDEHGDLDRQHAVLLVQMLGELLEIHAADEFHRDEVNSLGFAQVVGLDDVRVNEVGHELGFADKILDELLLVGVALADDFDRHALDEVARPVLFGFVNDPHPALEDLPDDLVAELRVNGEERSHRRRMFGIRGGKSSPASVPGRFPMGPDPQKIFCFQAFFHLQEVLHVR